MTEENYDNTGMSPEDFLVPVDLAEVKDFEPVPAAYYTAMITEIKSLAAKEGKEFGQFQMSLQIVGGEYDGRKVTRWLSKSPAALGFIKEFIKAVGGEMNRPNMLDFVGQTVGIKVSKGPRQGGGEINNVDSFFTPSV